MPSPTTSRYHCIVWSDWVSQAKAELASGIRLDTNYYYYPGSWIADRPGFMNGSGMPMRFTDTDGSMIDVFQANTNMTDESGQTYPFTPNTLLDRALGSQGYYGAFTANLHTDSASTFEDTQVLASAQARGVPVIAARQLLTWTDGRNGSSFSGISWSGSTLSFTVGIGVGATGLTAMLPTTGPGGSTLTAVTRGGTAVPFTTMTVKGQQYAVFPAVGGAHQATYAAGGGGGANRVSGADRHDLRHRRHHGRPGRPRSPARASCCSAPRPPRSPPGSRSRIAPPTTSPSSGACGRRPATTTASSRAGRADASPCGRRPTPHPRRS